MAPDERQSYLDSAPLCSHLDCAEAAVPLAVEVHRSHCLLLLLATGATATGLEAGLIALEAGLQREAGLRNLEAGPHRGAGLTEHTEALRCIYFLLLFGSAPTPRPMDRSTTAVHSGRAALSLAIRSGPAHSAAARAQNASPNCPRFHCTTAPGFER